MAWLIAECPPLEGLRLCFQRLTPIDARIAARLAGYYATLDQLMSCSKSENSRACMVAIMRQERAPASAIAFLESTGWLISDFIELGPRDLAVILDPLLLNGNYQFGIVNGAGGIIFPAVAVETDLIWSDGALLLLKRAYEDRGDTSSSLRVWVTDVWFESQVQGQSVQDFYLQFNVVNACHACSTGYAARFSFSFDRKGNFLGSEFVGLCRRSLREVDIGASPCPSADLPGPGKVSSIARSCAALARALLVALCDAPMCNTFRRRLRKLLLSGSPDTLATASKWL